MRKFLVSEDGQRREISPISYTEFIILGLYEKIPNESFSYPRDKYEEFLEHNKFLDAKNSYTSDHYRDHILQIHLFDEPYMKFNVDGKWVDFEIGLSIKSINLQKEHLDKMKKQTVQKVGDFTITYELPSVEDLEKHKDVVSSYREGSVREPKTVKRKRK